ncbi:SLC13 family permease [Amycolatopsis nigrescens]|uniref:SLC13 family permease n=1 Tax=Amycolatopsis nigrescens TaxID=381445 RepID=UPI000A045A19|nr:SLC13 family permease [Amycolatopsis nigrescens]
MNGTTATAPLNRPTVPLRTARPSRKRLWQAGFGLLAVLALVLLYLVLPGQEGGLPPHGRIALVIFAAAVLAWMFARVDDTFVGLLAAVALVVTGVIDADTLFGALGGETVWLLIGAFVLAAGLAATGLPERAAVVLVARARSVRQLAHLVTVAVAGTALAVPATSGRAALLLPVFLALARALAGRPSVVRALALLFPTVILLSAAATLIGAGAHLITSQVLAGATGAGIGFGRWLLLGLPFALLSSHLAAELVLLLMTSRADRRLPLSLDVSDFTDLAGRTGVAATGPLSAGQKRAAVVLAAVVLLWCTESLHGLAPALVALLGALLITAPRLGTTAVGGALATVPWSLLLFMTTTAVLGTALSASGAAAWLTGLAFGHGGAGGAPGFLVTVVVLSAAAHLVLQSRSARSSVLVPLVIPPAIAFGLNPAAVAFASTVAAGFCHTLPASAKPVALFSALEDVPTYRRSDLLRLSALLGPVVVLLVLGFAVTVWPALGLPLR